MDFISSVLIRKVSIACQVGVCGVFLLGRGMLSVSLTTYKTVTTCTCSFLVQLKIQTLAPVVEFDEWCSFNLLKLSSFPQCHGHNRCTRDADSIYVPHIGVVEAAMHSHS